MQTIIIILLALIICIILILRFNPRLDTISQDSCSWLVVWYDSRLYPDGSSDRDYKILLKLRNKHTDNYE